MIFVKKDEKYIKEQLDSFYSDSGKIVKRHLLIDYTGINVTYAVLLLFILGFDRFKKFRRVHSISGGSLAVLFFYAFHIKQTVIDEKNLSNFKLYKELRNCKFIPFFSLFRYLLNFKINAVLFSGNIKDSFLDFKVKSLPHYLSFYCYNKTKDKIVEINSQNEYMDMPLRDLILASVSLENVFADVYFNGDLLVDTIRRL